MKIRIRDNNIRLRLTKTDVEALKRAQFVTCQTVISGREIFKYELRIDTNAKTISASFSHNKITIVLPSEDAKTLTDTNEITVKGWQENGEEDRLFLLIEKDLQCLDETEEDQSDMYDNPNTVC